MLFFVWLVLHAHFYFEKKKLRMTNPYFSKFKRAVVLTIQPNTDSAMILTPVYQAPLRIPHQ